jgi:hypothetical protein
VLICGHFIIWTEDTNKLFKQIFCTLKCVNIFRLLCTYFFPWLYSPILGHGRLHETFRFISVTRSRTASRTPWTGDQLVARPLRVCPGWLWGWRSWWNVRVWQRKPKYSDRTCPNATLSTTNPTCQIRARTRAAAMGIQRVTSSAMARPLCIYSRRNTNTNKPI